MNMVARAKELVDLAGRTEGISTNYVPFAAAQVLHEEGFTVSLMTQLFFVRDRPDQTAESITSETMMMVDRKLVDEYGVYQRIEEVAEDRKKRWRLHSIQIEESDIYTPGCPDLAGHVYSRWGYTANDTARMDSLLRSEDAAFRLTRDTEAATRKSARHRL